MESTENEGGGEAEEISYSTPPNADAQWWLPVGVACTARARAPAARYSSDGDGGLLRGAWLGLELPQTTSGGFGSPPPNNHHVPSPPPPSAPLPASGLAVAMNETEIEESAPSRGWWGKFQMRERCRFDLVS